LDNGAEIKNSTTKKLFFGPHKSFIVSKTRPENHYGSLQTCILDGLKVLSHLSKCGNDPNLHVLEVLLQRRSSFHHITDHPGAFIYN